MVPLTRILSLTAACALVTAAIPARAGEFAQKQASVGTDKPSVTQCGMLKRAISRRACHARLESVAPINTAANR